MGVFYTVNELIEIICDSLEDLNLENRNPYASVTGAIMGKLRFWGSEECADELSRCIDRYVKDSNAFRIDDNEYL